MPPPQPPRPPSPLPRALRHPLWWSALTLLVLNDHLLKGSGLLPGWLTGKLSDVAGLVLAPALAAHLVRARSRRACIAAGAAVGAVFAAINVSPAASDALVAAAARAGLAWRLWPDPGDLVALAALPLGIALALPGKRVTRARIGDRLVLAVAVVACLASSADDEAGSSGSARSANVENATEETVVLIAASTEAAGGCDLYTEDRISILTDDAFVRTRSLRLEPGDRVAVSERGDCSAAHLQLPDGTATRFYWTGLKELEAFLPPDDPQRVARTAVIEGEADDWSFELGADLVEYDPERRPPDPSCPQAPDTPSLEWTPLPIAQGWLDLTDITEDADGCLSIAWAMPGDAPEGDGGVGELTQTLCVPDWAFAFEPGDRLSVLEQRDGSARSLRVARHREGGALDAELALFADVTRLEDAAFAGLRAVECFGSISECGAYLRPVEVELRDGQRLSAGEESDLSEAAGRSTQVLIGPAFDVGWAGRRCDGREATTGMHASALVLRRY